MYRNLKNCNTFSDFLSKPSCTDIMEIYNAVEEMDDDEEVSFRRQLLPIIRKRINSCS